MGNIAYIYQPHFKTDMFRVAVKDQQSDKENFIVVTCSPEYNGVYSYPARYIKEKNYQPWYNNKTLCICVPVKDCTKLKNLEELKNQDIVKKVKRQQALWYKNNVRNRDYAYKERPEWML